jgi:Fic family protein
MVDAIELESGVATKATDAGDILFYVKALDHGMKRLTEFPLSLRVVKEIHKVLMDGARATHFSDPGEFRNSQNWIGGTSPANARFVPPPVHEMKAALGDLEKYLHDEKAVLPLIHIALMHAQFETIHPFLDGNGRAGRLLITMLLCHRNLLERPVLFLSSYFKKHQKLYYHKLHAYSDGEVEPWLDFFLDGVIETANQSIEISKEIRTLRDTDMQKIQVLAKRESESGMKVLSKLYASPIVNTRTVMDWTGFSRPGAQKVIDRLIGLSILKAQKDEGVYDQTYVYEKYLRIFTK